MERKANIIIEKTSGENTGKVAEGYVFVGAAGTLGDHINDADADLGDVYDEVEFAISGEDIVGAEGGELTGDVDVDGVTYRWTVHAPDVSADDLAILAELRAARDEERDADVDEEEAFHAVYGRDSDANDRDGGLWSLIYAGLDA